MPLQSTEAGREYACHRLLAFRLFPRLGVELRGPFAERAVAIGDRAQMHFGSDILDLQWAFQHRVGDGVTLMVQCLKSLAQNLFGPGHAELSHRADFRWLLAGFDR